MGFWVAIVASPVTLPYLTLTVPNNITKERKKEKPASQTPIRGGGNCAGVCVPLISCSVILY